MGLQPKFALVNSEYNDFLYASVADEKSGLPLTVLSALTRLDLDPWGEAARLAALPRDAAARTLAAAIALLPDIDWGLSDAAVIAARLVDRLPRRVARLEAAARDLVDIERPAKTKAAMWALAGFFIAAMLLSIWHYHADRSADPGVKPDTPTQQ